MDAEAHLSKAQIVAKEAETLNWPDDYEMSIEAVMHRATHIVNARLHLEGLTETSEDLVHVGMPRDVVSPDGTTEALISGLQSIERLRALHVRGPLGPSSAIKEEYLSLRSRCDSASHIEH